MRNNSNRLCLATAITVCFVAPAMAQAPAAGGVSYELGKIETNSLVNSATGTLLSAIPQGAGGFKTESGITLYPSVAVGIGFNDNLNLTSANKVSSNFVNISPTLLAAMNYKGDRYTALASMDTVSYPSNSLDNTRASAFKLAADKYFSTRARGGLSAEYNTGTSSRDANVPSAEPDRYHGSALNGTFAYGAAGAKGRLEADAGLTNKTFDNNRAKTALLDLDVTSVAGRAFVKVGGRTLGLVEVSNAKTNYVSALSQNLNNTERKYYLGLTWDATAATTGIVKVGRMTKDFDSGKQGYSGASWDASVRWLPRTYSAFTLQTSKNTADTTDAASFSYSLNTATNLSWNHSWSSVISTSASVGVSNATYPGTLKADVNTNTYSLGASYAFRRWLSLGVDFTNTDATSSNPLSAYKKNVTMFTLNASL